MIYIFGLITCSSIFLTINIYTNKRGNKKRKVIKKSLLQGFSIWLALVLLFAGFQSINSLELKPQQESKRFTPMDEKLNIGNDTIRKHLTISDDTFNIALNNLSEDCLFFANFYDISNIDIRDMSESLDSTCNNNDLLNKIECGNEILLEVHNISERAVTDLKLSWHFNLVDFEKFIKMYDQERSILISQERGFNKIKEKDCELGIGSMCSTSYFLHKSGLDFLHPGDYKQIKLPVDFTKLAIIFAYYRSIHEKKIDFEDIPKNSIPKIVAKFEFKDYKEQIHEEKISIYPSYCSSIGNPKLGCFNYTVNFTKDETSLNWY